MLIIFFVNIYSILAKRPLQVTLRVSPCILLSIHPMYMTIQWAPRTVATYTGISNLKSSVSPSCNQCLDSWQSHYTSIFIFIMGKNSETWQMVASGGGFKSARSGKKCCTKCHKQLEIKEILKKCQFSVTVGIQIFPCTMYIPIPLLNALKAYLAFSGYLPKINWYSDPGAPWLDELLPCRLYLVYLVNENWENLITCLSPHSSWPSDRDVDIAFDSLKRCFHMQNHPGHFTH